MDLLPYDFCLSVCSTLADLKLLKTTCCNYPVNLEIWKAAVETVNKKRLNISFSFGVHRKMWSYKIEGYKGYMTEPGEFKPASIKFGFSEFKNLDKEEIQLKKVAIDTNAGNESSLEEIEEIIAYLGPFENMTSLHLGQLCTPHYSSYGLRAHILSFYRDSRIADILSSDNSIHKSVDDFLQLQLKSNSLLRSFVVSGDHWSQQLLTAVEDFALKEQSIHVSRNSRRNGHDKDFFDKLIAKTLTSNSFVFEGSFSFDYCIWLWTRKGVFHTANTDGFQWTREDNITVSVRFHNPSKWSVRLVKNVSKATL